MRSLKKWLLIAAIALVALLVTAITISYFFSDEIKGLVIQSINKNLKTEVKVGGVNFSIIRKFPYASVEFNDVIAIGSLKDSSKPLLKAKKIYLLFNLSNLFRKNYSVNKIVLQEGQLNVIIDEVGNENYDIFKKNENDTSEFKLEIKKFEISAFDIVYFDKQKKQDYFFKNFNGAVSGNLSEAEYTMKVNAQCIVDHLISHSVNYIDQKESHIDADININSKTQKYKFENALVKIAGLDLFTEGKVESRQDLTLLDISVKSKDAGLENLFSLIPEKYLPNFRNFRHKGHVYFSAKISGIVNGTDSPDIQIDFGTSDASMQPKGSDYTLSKIKFEAFYHNKKSTTNTSDYFRIRNFSSLLDGQVITGKLELENFSKPFINVSLTGEGDLKVLSSFIKPDTLQSINGRFISQINFKGKLGEWSTYQASGTTQFENVNFRLKEKAIEFNNFNGNFSLQGNDLIITNFSGNAGKSDFLIKGKFNNLIPYLLLKNESLSLNGALYSKNLDLNEIIEHDSISAKGKSVYKLDFAKELSANVDVTIDQLSFRKFTATSINGNLSLYNQILKTQGLYFKSMDGEVNLKGSIDAIHPDSLIMTYDATITKLNIQQLFIQMGNFGQQVLTDKNIKGVVTASVQLASRWSKELDINSNQIFAQSEIEIDNGELLNFKPMLALAKYVKGSDLNDVKFLTLKNKIDIHNRKIFIPEMEIKSSALNLSGSGIHTFDNLVDYKIKLRLSDILGKKVKERNTEFGTIEEDGNGGLNLYLTMKGPMDNPKFSYDRKSVEQKIVNTIKKEKKNFWKIIKEEFKSPEKKDTDKQDQPQKQKPKKVELGIENDEENQN